MPREEYLDKNTLTFFFFKKKKTDSWGDVLKTLLENTLQTLTNTSFSPFFLSKHLQTRTTSFFPKTVKETIRRGNGSENGTSTRRGTGFLFFFLFYKYTLSFLFFISSSKYCVDVFTFMSDWIWKLSENVDRFLGFWRRTVENSSIGFYEKR